MVDYCIRDPHFPADRENKREVERCAWDGDPWPCIHEERNARLMVNVDIWLDELIAAVRAETLREVRGVVDNLTHSRAHPDDYYYSVSICDHSERDGRGGYDVYVERSDILAALDALAQPNKGEYDNAECA
jgi:hypothetical protein